MQWHRVLSPIRGTTCTFPQVSVLKAWLHNLCCPSAGLVELRVPWSMKRRGTFSHLPSIDAELCELAHAWSVKVSVTPHDIPRGTQYGAIVPELLSLTHPGLHVKSELSFERVPQPASRVALENGTAMYFPEAMRAIQVGCQHRRRISICAARTESHL